MKCTSKSRGAIIDFLSARFHHVRGKTVTFKRDKKMGCVHYVKLTKCRSANEKVDIPVCMPCFKEVYYKLGDFDLERVHRHTTKYGLCLFCMRSIKKQHYCNHEHVRDEAMELYTKRPIDHQCGNGGVNPFVSTWDEDKFNYSTDDEMY